MTSRRRRRTSPGRAGDTNLQRQGLGASLDILELSSARTRCMPPQHAAVGHKLQRHQLAITLDAGKPCRRPGTTSLLVNTASRSNLQELPPIKPPHDDLPAHDPSSTRRSCARRPRLPRASISHQQPCQQKTRAPHPITRPPLELSNFNCRTHAIPALRFLSNAAPARAAHEGSRDLSARQDRWPTH
jgi:hypothetical protein